MMEINFFGLGGNADGDNDNGYYFREPTSPEEASLVLVSAPWGVTSGNGEGSAYAPDAIIDSSASIGLFDAVSGVSLGRAVATAEIDYDIQESSQQLGSDAGKVIAHIEDGGTPSGEYFTRKISRVNEGFRQMHESIYGQVSRWAGKGKIVGTVGGDHSVSVGAVRAVAESCGGLGVLFIDAHCDLRGNDRVFEHSHMTVARDILDGVPSVEHMVQVGVRDSAEDEVDAARSDSRVSLFLAETLAAGLFEGRCWADLCREIIAPLPQKVYISIDADALAIECFPHTKRPVAGGLSFNETTYLINAVAESGREIVGFDLTEVVPTLETTTDAVVGARLLYKLCCASLKSRKNTSSK